MPFHQININYYILELHTGGHYLQIKFFVKVIGNTGFYFNLRVNRIEYNKDFYFYMICKACNIFLPLLNYALLCVGISHMSLIIK